MDYLDAKKLYRGIIIALISTVVPLVLLGSVQLIFGVKVSKDNAKAIQNIQKNYMRTDLFERYVILLEEREIRNREIYKEIKGAIGTNETEIKEIYKQMRDQAIGKFRGNDSLNITYNGIYKNE